MSDASRPNLPYRLRSADAAQAATLDGDAEQAPFCTSAHRASSPPGAGAGGTRDDAPRQHRRPSKRGKPGKSSRDLIASPHCSTAPKGDEVARPTADGRGLGPTGSSPATRADSAEVPAKPPTSNDIVKGLQPVLCPLSTSRALPFEDFGDEGMRWVVDRTPYLIEASTLGAKKTHLLTRPRRFGKTTFIRMLHEYWDCAIPDNEYAASMTGFWIAQHKERWKGRGEYMVWACTLPTSAAELELQVMNSNRAFAARYNMDLPDPISDMGQLFASARARHPPRKIAVLLDEYDAIVNHSTRIEKDAIDFSPGVRACTSFFNHIKTLLDEGSISIAFFTGLTPIAIKRFGGGFNCIVDHTCALKFAYVCGFLDSDVAAGLRVAMKRHAPPDALEDRVRRELQRMQREFNGYRFATRLPESPCLASVHHSTCVTHYLSILGELGGVQSSKLVSPMVSLSDHAADVISAMPSHVDLLTDLLLNDRRVSLESLYVTSPRIPRDLVSSRAVCAALLFYHGAATLASGEAGSNDLECPNDSIAVEFLQRIGGTIMQLPNLQAAAHALARDGDAATFIDAVFRNEPLIRVSETGGQLSEAALRLRLVCAFVGAAPETYHVLAAETRLGVHTALKLRIGSPGRADLLVLGKLIIEVKVATSAVRNAVQRIRNDGGDCSLQTLLEGADAVRKAIRDAAAQAANYKIEAGVRKFVCLALNRETAFTIELDGSLTVDILSEPQADIAINEEGRLVCKLVRKTRKSRRGKRR